MNKRAEKEDKLDSSKILFRMPFMEYFVAKGDFGLLCFARKKFNYTTGRYYFVKI